VEKSKIFVKIILHVFELNCQTDGELVGICRFLVCQGIYLHIRHLGPVFIAHYFKSANPRLRGHINPKILSSELIFL
jgi:hypothetical protein